MPSAIREERPIPGADAEGRISIVRFRTVLAVVFAHIGKSSPKKSATLPNGNKAAMLAARYFNSGGVRFPICERRRETPPLQSEARNVP